MDRSGTEGSDRSAIAARARALIGGGAASSILEAAERLGVSDVALRVTLDPVSAHPVLDVLAGMVRIYGLDPTWLLTGEYDGWSHARTADRGHAEIVAELRRIAALHHVRLEDALVIQPLKLVRNADRPSPRPAR